ncbi:MAG TPA: hypothetical protein VEO92_02000, partial [Candidatus Nitrosocosmicus sp.]|nr:hypothetical protein [Candidatus Nitrosocosmicus sp.]
RWLPTRPATPVTSTFTKSNVERWRRAIKSAGTEALKENAQQCAVEASRSYGVGAARKSHIKIKPKAAPSIK